MMKIFVLLMAFTPFPVALAEELPKSLTLSPPARARWTISYQHRDQPVSAGTEEKVLIKAEYAVDESLGRLTKTYFDGTREESYVVENLGFIDDPESKRVRVEAIDNSTGDGLRFKSFYPGFEWIKQQYYVETVEKEGRRLLHFRQAAGSPHLDTNGGLSLEYRPDVSLEGREAWIDLATGLPASFRIGAITGVYQHEPPLQGRITLPPAFEKALRFYQGY